MDDYYDELLEVCGFTVEEIDQERYRIEKAFRKLELGPEDMARAVTWVSYNHDVELAGVRMMLGIWLKELIDLVLAKDEGKKLVYFGFPPWDRYSTSSRQFLRKEKITVCRWDMACALCSRSELGGWQKK